MKIIELPDGTEAEFPDDMEDSEIEAVLRRQFGGPDGAEVPQGAPPPQASPEPPMVLSGGVSPEAMMAGATTPGGAFGADLVIGALKGAANTAIGTGRAMTKLGGALGIGSGDTSALDYAREAIGPTSPAQGAGRMVEQAAEYMAPVGSAGRLATKGAALLPRALSIVPRAAAEGGAAGVTAGLQGGDPRLGAAMGAGGVLAGGAVGGALSWVGRQAEPLVRAAIKPTVAAMRRIAGASVEGIEAKATQMVRFIIENKITTPDKARNIVAEAERELQRVLKVKNAPTDAGPRAVRYLDALKRSAAKQGLPASDVATIERAAAEVLESSLGRDVVQLVPVKAGTPGSVGKLKPVVTGRQARPDVTAEEALERARATSKWSTRKSYGEQKGAEKESAKAVERALRDAVKAGVPETAPLLSRQSQALQAAETLDRSAFRGANRDAISLPAHVIAAGEIARGGVPLLAVAANLIRNHQMKLGIWAGALAKAVARQDARSAAVILRRLGVGVPSAATGQPARAIP